MDNSMDESFSNPPSTDKQDQHAPSELIEISSESLQQVAGGQNGAGSGPPN